MSNESTEAGAHGRFGYVSAYDPQKHMARIQFPDKGDLVSAWLPVAVLNSKKNHDECHLDVGEHVYCNMMGNGLESGVVLCAVYDDKNKPPEGNQDIRKTNLKTEQRFYTTGKINVWRLNARGMSKFRRKGISRLKQRET